MDFSGVILLNFGEGNLFFFLGGGKLFLGECVSFLSFGNILKETLS